MVAIKRVVSTSFWEDDKVIDNFTPEDKYFMLYLLTNPHTKQIGIYPLNVRQASFETGYNVDSISHLLNRFENVHKIIKRSEITSEIAIKNYLCYSIVKGGKPVIDCLEKEMKTTKDKSLIDFVLKNLSEKDDLLETVKNFVASHYKNDNENDNDNDNENERTSNVRSNVRIPYVEEKPNNDNVHDENTPKNHREEALAFLEEMENKANDLQ